MKIKEGFVLRSIGNEHMVIPLGKNSMQIHGVIRLNETSAFLWSRLMKETSEEKLLSDLLSEYDIDEAIAQKDIESFINKLNSYGLLE